MTNYSMPGDVLERYAYENVWCTPDQDNQVIFRPARISPINGQWTYFTHMWRRVYLPTTRERYHIYQIGGINPELLGLEERIDKWVSVTEVMTLRKIIIDTYTGKGFQIPRCLVYYRYTSDHNLIIAIQQPYNEIAGWDWEKDTPYVRLYSNAYFDDQRSKSNAQYVNCISRRVADRSAVQALVNDVNNMPFTVGVKYFFINGQYAPSITVGSIDNGSYVDCIYDSSIKRVIDFDIASLKEFNSIKDGVRKYLLHYSGKADMIDYQDDIDCFVYADVAAGRTRGVYLHKNSAATLRNVTHRDYAVAVPVIDAVINSSGVFTPTQRKRLRLHIRHSGYERPLVLEANRIHELYRLDDASVQRALLGMDAVVDEWRAENLENSAYTQVMAARNGTITRQLSAKMLGYHAISQLIGGTPVKTERYSGKTVAAVPVGLWGNCMCYEYADDGSLLGWGHHTSGPTYVCRNAGAAVVEMLFGKGDEQPEIIDNVLTGTMDVQANYRFYYCTRDGGQDLLDWKPAAVGMYLVQNGTYTWTSSTVRGTRVVSNRKHLLYEFDYSATDGVLRFNLVRKVANGSYEPLDMPFGELDIWLNRKKLIENVDYIVQFPVVAIINKEHLINGGVGPQNVVVRFKGFCDDDMTHRKLEEVGFVEHDNLSYNLRYNVRNDHVKTVNIGGAFVHPSDVRFAEDGVLIGGASVRNGKPYSIRNVVVPIAAYVAGEGGEVDVTYQMLEQAKELDKRIEDYMTLHRPQVKTNNPNVIRERWVVYSPFFTKIITDLRDGILWEDDFTRHYGSEYVDAVLQRYKHLLDFDLSREDGLFDERYVVVHPHPYSTFVQLDAYQHKFLRFAYELYGRRVADLADFVSIRPFDL